MSVYCENDNDEVKKLVYIALGCTNWKVGNEDGDGKRALSSLSIEELNDDEENDDE